MKKYIPEIASLTLLIAGIVMRAYEYTPFESPVIQFFYYLTVFLPVGFPVVKEACESLCKGEVFNEFTLMLLASVGAFYIGEYPEGVAVMLFYSVGEKLQESAVDRARKHIQALIDVRPETARVITHEQTREIVPDQITPGSIIEVRAGERIPLDGILLSEEAVFDTAALTGESVPRHIGKGSEVLAGMIVTDRVIRLRTTRPASESALARILAMVEDAAARKAPTELFIRRFARIYTPIVTLLAVLIVFTPYLYSLTAGSFAYDFDEWLYRGLIFLVISCPCALVVSIPLGYFGGIGAASRLGILFKGGNYLDAITQIDTVVFDKTGTLTRGRFEISEMQSNSLDPKELLQLVASVEAGSNHPIAQAIVEEARKQGLTLDTPASLQELSGRGLKAVTSHNQTVLAGNSRLMQEAHIDYPHTLDNVVETPVLCAIDGRFAGYLLLSDAVKPDSLTAVKALKTLNINKIQILSGDKQAIVSKLASHLGIGEAYGDLLPEGKVEHLEALKKAGHKVAFAGDGMNDTPVLALSDVGIAMGALGSDAAIETADVIIQTDQPHKIATAIRIGRITQRIVWQNITLSLGVKFVVMLLGALGMANLWAAVFADVGVAMLAIGNALRIRLKKE